MKFLLCLMLALPVVLSSVCDMGEPFESTGCESDGGNCDGVFVEEFGICVYCVSDSNALITEEMVDQLEVPAVWCQSITGLTAKNAALKEANIEHQIAQAVGGLTAQNSALEEAKQEHQIEQAVGGDTYVSCGYKPMSGRAGHCKMWRDYLTIDYCRNYMRGHPNAIAFRWANLWGIRGYCIIYFNSAVTSCPDEVGEDGYREAWYQDYYLGTVPYIVRDGTCNSGSDAYYYEYKKVSVVDCGYSPISGIAGHCKTNEAAPTKEWCRDYMTSHENAIAFRWANLWGTGTCIIYFDSTVRTCPPFVVWYQNYYLGTPPTLVRDGSCAAGSNTYYYGYREQASQSQQSLAFSSLNYFSNEYTDNAFKQGALLVLALVGLVSSVLFVRQYIFSKAKYHEVADVHAEEC